MRNKIDNTFVTLNRDANSLPKFRYIEKIINYQLLDTQLKIEGYSHIVYEY